MKTNIKVLKMGMYSVSDYNKTLYVWSNDLEHIEKVVAVHHIFDVYQGGETILRGWRDKTSLHQNESGC